MTFHSSPRRNASIRNGQNSVIQRPEFQEQQPSRPPATNLHSIPNSPSFGFQTPNKVHQFTGVNASKPPTTNPNGSMNFQKAPQALPQQRNLPANRPQVSSLQPPQPKQTGVGPTRPTNQSPSRHIPPLNGSTRAGSPPFHSSGSADPEPPISFFTARVAETVQNATAVPSNVPVFNPHLESPSIRKTAGIDHTKTKPVGRDSLGVTAPVGGAGVQVGPGAGAGAGLPPMRSNFVNPQADQARRIGMPGSAVGSPLQNRSSYKPPQMVKRMADGSGAQYVNTFKHLIFNTFKIRLDQIRCLDHFTKTSLGHLLTL